MSTLVIFFSASGHNVSIDSQQYISLLCKPTYIYRVSLDLSARLWQMKEDTILRHINSIPIDISHLRSCLAVSLKFKMSPYGDAGGEAGCVT